MSVLRLSPLCLVLILASSALGTLPYAYPDHPAVPLSFGPHLIYGSGIGNGDGDLAGFSYFTKDPGGGRSEVVFLTGPNSDIKMNAEVAAMKDQMSSFPAASMEPKPDMDDNKELQSVPTDNEDASDILSLVPVENKESSTPQNQAETGTSTSAKPMEEKQKDSDGVIQGIFNGQLIPERSAGFDTPYPVLRLGSSALFYPQLPTTFSGFAGHGPSDYVKSQYVPFVNSYDYYQSLYNPLYSPLDTSYYNPGVFPTVYQSSIFAPSAVSSLVPEKNQDAGPSVKNPLSAPTVNTRIGEGMENSDKQASEDSSPTEKATELPTTTEQAVEKETTLSETASSTTEEVKETTTVSSATTVADDAVAVE